MERIAFESQLRSEGYSVVNSSLKPNKVEANHCHDFDAKVSGLLSRVMVSSPPRTRIFASKSWQWLASTLFGFRLLLTTL